MRAYLGQEALTTEAGLANLDGFGLPVFPRLASAAKNTNVRKRGLE